MTALKKRIQVPILIVALIVVPLLTIGTSSKAYATTFPICTWTGNGGNTNFSNAANWSGCGGAPVSGSGPISSGTYEILYFDNSSLTQNELLNNDLGSLVVHEIRFMGSNATYGFRITGDPIVGGPSGSYVVDNTNATYASGFNNTLSFPGGSVIINLYNPSGTYFANIQGSTISMIVGGNGGIMQVADLSNLTGIIAPISDEIDLMPTGDMTSNVIFNNLSKLGLDNQGPDNSTYTYAMNFDFANGVDNSNAQIYLPSDADSNVQSVLSGDIGLYSTVSVNPSGNNTLNITAPILDNGYTITAVSSNTTVTVDSGDDQSASNPTVGQNVTYVVDGTLGNITVGEDGLLKGNGTVASADIASGGGISPGHSPGCLTVSGDLTLNGAYTADIQSPGATACTDYDQLLVGGTIDLTGSNLSINFLNGFTPTAGQSFEIINNGGGNAVTGTFNGLAEGAIFSVGNTKLRITYSGGGGNNVVLTVVNPSTPLTATVGAPDTGFGTSNDSTSELYELLVFSSFFVIFGLMLIAKTCYGLEN